jgi:hypothetical protein
MTAFDQAWGLVKEYSNHDLNYFFRGGHPKNTFEYGQQQVPDWRGKKEYSVLLDRVAQNKKPIASVVLDNHPNKEEVWEEITSKELDAKRLTNEWGIDMAYFTNMGDSSLQDLADSREINLPPNPRNSMSVRNFINSGFDMASEHNPVNLLESALLLGYPYEEGQQ